MNFDRMRFVADRADVGEAREAAFAVTLPEERGSFRRFCAVIGQRNVTEFNYRIADERRAHIFVGVQIARRGEAADISRPLQDEGFDVRDLSHDELSKQHIRYMVGGRSPLAAGERLFRFEFPERPGALMKFLSAMAPNWNISLFHYRNQGVDFSSALVGIQAPPADATALDAFLAQLGYAHSEKPTTRLTGNSWLEGADRHGVAVRVARGEGALGARIAHARLLAGARGMRLPPPALARVRRGDVDAFAHHRRGDLDAARRGQRHHLLERIIPGVHRQIERAVVDRQQPAAAQILVGLHGFGRLHVHVGPLRIVGAGFHQGQVKGTEAPADFGEAVEIAAVAAEEDAQLVVLDHPGRPQRAIAVGEAASGKCWAGVAVRRRPSISTSCHQSNWRIRSADTRRPGGRPRPAATGRPRSCSPAP